MDITISIEGLDLATAGPRLHAEVLRGEERAVRLTAETAEREAKRLAPFKTGKLHDSIKAEQARTTTNTVAADVRARAKHASFVSDGTPPHVIQARRKQVLHFEGAGGEVFVRRVNHPGTKPNDYWREASARADKMLLAATERAAQEAADRIR